MKNSTFTKLFCAAKYSHFIGNFTCDLHLYFLHVFFFSLFSTSPGNASHVNVVQFSIYKDRFRWQQQKFSCLSRRNCRGLILHLITLNDAYKQSVGLTREIIGSSPKSVPTQCQLKEETSISGTGTRDPINRRATVLRLRPHDHRNWSHWLIT